MRRALLWSYLEKYGTYGLGLVASMILARLLSPEEIGTFSVAAVLVGFAGTVRDMGAGVYVIQCQDLTAQKIQTTRTIALLIGWGIAAIVGLIAPLVGSFYDSTAVRDILWILALNFAIVPLGSVTMALLSRDLRFNVIARVNVLATIVSSGCAILLAAQGVGSNSLAWGMLASASFTAAMAYFYRPRHVSWRPSLQNARDVVRFGGFTSTAQLSNELVLGAPDLGLAKLDGFGSAGEFSRATGLAQAFNQTVLRGLWPVLLPYFAQARRDGQAIDKPYIKMVTCATGLGWPFFGMLLLLAPELVHVMFGPDWAGSAPVLRALAVSSGIALMFAFAVPSLTATGNVKEVMHATLSTLPFRLAIIGGACALGPVAAGFGVGLAALLFGYRLQSTVRREIGVGWRAMAHALAPSGTLACGTLAAPLALRLAIDFGVPGFSSNAYLHTTAGAIAVCAALSVVAALGFLITLRMARHPLLELIVDHMPRGLTRLVA